MLDFNFEKSMPKKLLNKFYRCYFDIRNQTGEERTAMIAD